MHRAISGDLQNEDEMDRAMEESGEEGIYQVKSTLGFTSLFVLMTFNAALVDHGQPVRAVALQRSHGLFGNRGVEAFPEEVENPQSQHPPTHLRPLKFAENQSDSSLVPSGDFFHGAAPRNNANNNAFAE